MLKLFSVKWCLIQKKYLTLSLINNFSLGEKSSLSVAMKANPLIIRLLCQKNGGGSVATATIDKFNIGV